jgi:CheY-like chemotaxis protein
VNELKRILLVEDNPKDAQLTLRALGDAHLANEVIVVRDGDEALDYLHRRGLFELRALGSPAVVMLDLKLPRISGLEVLKQMRATPELSKIPVVMLTSSREEQDVQTSYELGVNAYVVKPVDFKEFLSALKTLGVFWAVVNQPPNGCVRYDKPREIE